MEEELTIRRLSPELCEDWLHYFDNIAFQDHGEWAYCYCLEGHLDRHTDENLRDHKERREKAITFIREGKMQGYLAYLGNTVVGWCNVNDRKNYHYVTEMFRESGYWPNEAPDTKVKAVYCFLTAPQYRGRGIAARLLEQVCGDAAQEGYACVEAYPYTDRTCEFQYHGSAKMYERSGFTEAADLKYVKVMRKDLRQEKA